MEYEPTLSNLYRYPLIERESSSPNPLYLNPMVDKDLLHLDLSSVNESAKMSPKEKQETDSLKIVDPYAKFQKKRTQISKAPPKLMVPESTGDFGLFSNKRGSEHTHKEIRSAVLQNTESSIGIGFKLRLDKNSESIIKLDTFEERKEVYFPNKESAGKNQNPMNPHNFFNPFSHKSDSFVEENLSESDEVESRAKKLVEEGRITQNNISYFGNKNFAQKESLSKKIHGDSGSTQNLETEKRKSEENSMSKEASLEKGNLREESKQDSQNYLKSPADDHPYPNEKVQIDHQVFETFRNFNSKKDSSEKILENLRKDSNHDIRSPNFSNKVPVISDTKNMSEDTPTKDNANSNFSMSQEMINDIIMKQIDNDMSVMSYVHEQNQSQKPTRSTHSLSRQDRCSSAVSRLHSKHLVGHGFSEIMSKISEENERTKKLYKKRKRNFRKKRQLSKETPFASNNSSMNEFVFKKRIADDISHMIIENLQKYQGHRNDGASFSIKKDTTNASPELRKKKLKTKLFGRAKPNLDKYFISFRRKKRNIVRELSAHPHNNNTSSIDIKIDTGPDSFQGKPAVASQGYRDTPLINTVHRKSLGDDEKPTIKINGDVIFNKPVNEESFSKRLFNHNSNRKIASAKNRDNFRFSKRKKSMFSQFSADGVYKESTENSVKIANMDKTTISKNSKRSELLSLVSKLVHKYKSSLHNRKNHTRSESKTKKFFGISPVVSNPNISNNETITQHSLAKCYASTASGFKIMKLSQEFSETKANQNADILKAPISGTSHIQTRRLYPGGKLEIINLMSDIELAGEFYKPIVLQGKNKVINNKFSEGFIRKEIKKIEKLAKNNEILAKGTRFMNIRDAPSMSVLSEKSKENETSKHEELDLSYLTSQMGGYSCPDSSDYIDNLRFDLKPPEIYIRRSDVDATKHIAHLNKNNVTLFPFFGGSCLKF
ncbi:unnamed protein product [Moneuplotes crassus]|uniref:Uncharacterized protein n=1 Tax=Euplotes crassus TaxID=5936 RepID=A0AAD1XJ26_EUPCR|nr:unnamed protein product [Moneuplotes crassus]